MSKAKHTPGPWVFDDGKGDPCGGCRTIKANGESIMGDATYYPWVPDREPDWHLIAAAPELLEALQMAFDEAIFPSAQISPVYEKCRAAIAKATGE